MSHDTPMLTFPALQTWLGKELELRGIDAVIYTRYILSIMQQDHFEVETDPDRDLFVLPHPHRCSSKETIHHHHHHHHQHQRLTKGGKRQHQKRRRSSWTAEDLKKNAVLECLHSVTGEECGIESLVEELCVKLKKVQEEREKKHCNIGGGGGSLPGSQSNSPKEKHHSNTDSSDTTPVSQAERYYEAFPALSDKTNLITTKDTNKPQGAWGSKGGKYRIRSPRDSDSNTSKKNAAGVRFSKSASVSRSSTSPTHNLFKKHQRTNSLPDNVSEKCRSPVFLVPRYQTKKSNQGNGNPRHHHHPDVKSSARHTLHTTEKTDGRNIKNGRKQKNCHHKGALKSAIHKSNKHSRLTEDSSWYTQPLAVPSEHLEENLHNSKLQTLYKTESDSPLVTSGDTSLEEAVSSLAESLCRDIMDDYNGELEELPKDTITKAIKSAAIKCGQLIDENEGSPSKMLKLDELMESKPTCRRRSAEDLTQVTGPDRVTTESMFGTSLPIHYDYEFMLSEMHQNGGNRVWSVDSLGVSSGDPQVTMEDIEGQSTEDLLGSASFLAAIWQKEPENATDPWPSDNSSRLKTSSPSSQMGVDSINERLEGDDDPEKAIPLQVMVDEGSVMVLDGGSTTTNLPIGTGRSNDSLLRICSPTHTHHHSHDGTFSSDQDEHYRSFTSWSTGDASDLQGGTPAGALTPADDSQEVVLPSDSTKDSLSLGIKAAVCDLTPSRDGQTVDVNNALWATYNEGQPRCIQPPKIVRWDDGIGMGELRMHRKKGPFIEGGVYGSPYNSCNNSHYSSCSTSPAESSIRDLWDRSSASQEDATLLSSSLQKLLSPKLPRDRERLGSGGPLGESTPRSLSPFECKSIDERSVIEDSLMDSPVFMGSRSSSRFDFAKSMSDVGDEGSSSPSSGTETDEMVSEAEFLEEVMKETVDIRELTENLDHKCNKKEHVEWSTNTGSLPDVDNTPQNFGFSLNQDFQLGSGLWGPPAETSIESGMFTSIMPVISKPEPVRSSGMQPDVAVGRPQDMFRGGGVEEIKATGMEEDLLISPKTHFRPIHEGVSPDSVEVDDDTPRNVQLKDVEEMGSYQVLPAIGADTDWSIHTGDSTSLYKPTSQTTSRFGFGRSEKSEPTEQNWQREGRWMEREISSSLYSALTKSGDTVDIDKVAFEKGKQSDVDISRDTKDLRNKYSSVTDLPRDKGPMKEPWDSGGGLIGRGINISSGLLMGKENKYGSEFDSTVNTDFEQQIFPYDDEVFILEECMLDDKTIPGPAYYSSDLEQQWIQEDGEETPPAVVVKPIPAKKRKPRGLRYRPCSFFLEGNCRRAGCRFAHDLSRIPCRFWEEGQCLKDEDCPFLHGYPSGYSSQEDSRQASGSENVPHVEDDGDEQMVPQGKPPSLSKPKSSTAQPLPPPHHNSSASSGESTPSHHRSGLLHGGPTTVSQPLSIKSSQLSSHCSSDCSSGSSNGKPPPRSLPIRIVAKNR